MASNKLQMNYKHSYNTIQSYYLIKHARQAAAFRAYRVADGARPRSLHGTRVVFRPFISDMQWQHWLWICRSSTDACHSLHPPYPALLPSSPPGR